ncbi:MAG: hypothetical protein ACK559_10500, partial [bacterium]
MEAVVSLVLDDPAEVAVRTQRAETGVVQPPDNHGYRSGESWKHIAQVGYRGVDCFRAWDPARRVHRFHRHTLVG